MEPQETIEIIIPPIYIYSYCFQGFTREIYTYNHSCCSRDSAMDLNLDDYDFEVSEKKFKVIENHRHTETDETDSGFEMIPREFSTQ